MTTAIHSTALFNRVRINYKRKPINSVRNSVDTATMSLISEIITENIITYALKSLLSNHMKKSLSTQLHLPLETPHNLTITTEKGLNFLNKIMPLRNPKKFRECLLSFKEMMSFQVYNLIFMILIFPKTNCGSHIGQ